jgi:flagellar hook-basal body complex protein FliE
VTTIASAIAAYANVAKAPVAEAAPSTGESTGASFGSVLMDAARSAVQTGKVAELKSAEALAGKADIREVVSAVANAELTLDTVVAVRDKVINAYNEILRMPI